ncbi:hypothetical protein ACRAD_28200 (plasmid) [Acinetobacter radioresistens DSM 6976 = NBRC 102413 = CIP 103788]|nr:hypothetical protein ACRAD_28200 [Acinetobacter radioresistens DSM 6976 = NBRC 102413 = CIP 103788]
MYFTTAIEFKTINPRNNNNLVNINTEYDILEFEGVTSILVIKARLKVAIESTP